MSVGLSHSGHASDASALSAVLCGKTLAVRILISVNSYLCGAAHMAII